LHQMEQPDSAKISALYKQTAQTVNVLTKPSDVKPSNSFMHIFSGDYSAGYYSYLWAEVISADIFYKISDGRNNHLAEQVSSIKKYVLVMLSQGGLTSSYETSNAVLGRPFAMLTMLPLVVSRFSFFSFCLLQQAATVIMLLGLGVLSLIQHALITSSLDAFHIHATGIEFMAKELLRFTNDTAKSFSRAIMSSGNSLKFPCSSCE
jgi:hypothetical protein